MLNFFMLFISMIKFKKKVGDVVEVGKEIMQNLPSGITMIGTLLDSWKI